MGGPLQSDLAIVVGAIDYGDADRIVTFLTREHGKLRGLARSAKKSQRRFGAALELCSKIEVRYSERPGAELAHIDACDLLDPYAGLRDDLVRLAAASYAVELAREAAQEKEASHALFDLLDRFLGALARGDQTFGNAHGMVRVFELRALDLLGWRPELDRCASCGGELGGAERPRFFFAPAAGGLVCSDCADGARGYWLSRETVAALRLVRAGKRVVLSPPVVKESGAALAELIDRHLERPLRSRAFLEST